MYGKYLKNKTETKTFFFSEIYKSFNKHTSTYKILSHGGIMYGIIVNNTGDRW